MKTTLIVVSSILILAAAGITYKKITDYKKATKA